MTFNYSKINILILGFIIICAALLRLNALSKVPPALFGDEIDVGYQAYSLLKTGKDMEGRPLPFFVRSTAEYRAPLFIYSDVPFIAIFGLNEWGVRLSAAFWGLVSILGLYLLVNTLFDTKVALISSAFMAISPWSIQYSRAAFEVTMLISFIIFGIYFYLLGLKKKYLLPISALLFGLTPYIYSTADVFVPLLILILLIINFKTIKDAKRWLTVALLVIFLTSLPAFWYVLRGQASQRFQLVSIFQDSVLLDKIDLARKGEIYYKTDGTKVVMNGSSEKVFYNKPAIFLQVFILNYLRAFSLPFLFSQGDPNLRQSIQEMGELYFADLLFILIGIRELFVDRNTRSRLLILGWLLISPIPAALTFDGGFHATRLFLMLPPLMILSALGAKYFLNQKFLIKCIGGSIALLLVINFIFYLHRYYLHYPIESWRFWQIGFKESMTYIADNQNNFNVIVMNNTYEPALERFLFYDKFDPALFQSLYHGEKLIKDIIPGVTGFNLGNKFYFGTLSGQYKGAEAFERIMKPGMLYLASARDETGGQILSGEYSDFRVAKTVYDPLGNPIFYLLEGK